MEGTLNAEGAVASAIGVTLNFPYHISAHLSPFFVSANVLSSSILKAARICSIVCSAVITSVSRGALADSLSSLRMYVKAWERAEICAARTPMPLLLGGSSSITFRLWSICRVALSMSEHNWLANFELFNVFPFY